MVVEKNSGAIVVRQSEFHGVFLAVIKIRRSIEKLKSNEPPLGVYRAGLDDIAVYSPHRSGNKKGIDRIISDNLNS